MKKLKNILVGFAICFAFVFMLASCSNATKSYSDKINEAYQSGTAITYDEAVKALGDECIDLTKGTESSRSGMLIAVKGMTKDNYEEKIRNASSDSKFDSIAITVVQGRCTYSHFASQTAGEVSVSILNGKNN